MKCIHEGCERESQSSIGLCKRHYESQRVAKYRRRPLTVEDAWQDAWLSVQAQKEQDQRAIAAMLAAGGAM